MNNYIMFLINDYIMLLINNYIMFLINNFDRYSVQSLSHSVQVDNIRRNFGSLIYMTQFRILKNTQ